VIVPSQTYIFPNSSIEFITGFFYETGFYNGLQEYAYNVLYCDITISNVDYHYSQNEFVTIESSTSAVELGRLFAATLDTDQMASRIAQRVDGTGYFSDSYQWYFAMEMSREVMGMASVIFEPQQVTSIQNSKLSVGCRIHLVPFGLLIGAVLIYAAFVLFIGLAALVETRGTAFVSLAHFRIASNASVVNSAFGRVEGDRTWTNDSAVLFSTESEEDRLAIGPTNVNTFEITHAQGLRKRSPS